MSPFRGRVEACDVPGCALRAKFDPTFASNPINNETEPDQTTPNPSSMDPILQGLNEPQQDAVTSPSNVLQILAPPGSGKTKTLTSRVAYLLQHHGYKPWDIICLTFTVKSSREMKERIARLLGSEVARRLILGTFHSVCRRYLVTYGHLIGIRKGFGIADSSDSTAIIKRIIKRLGLSIYARKAQSRISSSKSKGLTGSDQQVVQKTRGLVQNSVQKKDQEQQEFFDVFEAYQSQLAKSNLLDYDDLLLRCVDLLRQHPTCVSNVEVVLIDEFQDTNVVQFDLMRLFASKKKRVTTVGDPDQSIYGWRSAEIKNLMRMQQQYPGMLTIHLKDNYRSSGAILLAADEVIQQDASRPSKSLLPTHCPGTIPVLRRLPTAEIEALWIVSELQRAIGLTGRLLTYSDFAILLRTASLSRQVESAMGRAGVPYRMVGGQRFFDRLEVKILLDYLRVVSQPNNNDAVSRIINIPPRGLGVTTVKGLLEEAETQKLALWTLLRNSTHTTTRTKLSKAAEQGLGSFVNLILTSRNKILDAISLDSPEKILRYLIEKLKFQHYLQKSHADDHEARWVCTSLEPTKSPKTLSRDSHAPPESIVLTWRNETGERRGAYCASIRTHGLWYKRERRRRRPAQYRRLRTAAEQCSRRSIVEIFGQCRARIRAPERGGHRREWRSATAGHDFDHPRRKRPRVACGLRAISVPWLYTAFQSGRYGRRTEAVVRCNDPSPGFTLH